MISSLKGERRTLLLLSALATASAFAWTPVKAPYVKGAQLMTEWGEKVTPENAWRDYPRPQMVRDGWTNLNGLWDYAITSNATYASVSPWDRFETCRELMQRGKILVPFALETPLSGVGRLLGPSELLWYRRTLNVRKEAGKRILLHFGAVDFRCQVFIGHDEVTDVPHEGGLVPFTVDVTDFVKDGDNELVLCVWDPTSLSLGATGKQVFNPFACCYTRMSGVWQTVWAETVPEDYVKGYRVVTDIDRATVRIEVEVEGDGRQMGISVFDADGKKVGEMSRQSASAYSLRIPAPRLWSPEDPYLYTFIVRYGQDKVKGYFGMRKFEKRRDANGTLRFFLNNKPYFILGPLDQGWWPDGFLTPPSVAAIESEIKTLKSLGCNMMRKHMKDEPAVYYHLCDKLGILVVQDMVAGGGDRNLRYGFFRREFKDMVDCLCNFPSIVMWSPFNEDWGCQPGEFFTHNTLDWIRRYDPTRLVNGPSGWNDYEGGDFRLASGKVTHGLFRHKPQPQCEAADAVDMHVYHGPGMHPTNDRRVSFLGEYGGLGQKVPGHLWDEKKTWGYDGGLDTSSKDGLMRAYLGLMDSLAALAFKGLGGAVYTQTSDVELEVNGYLTYDRKVLKYDAAKLAAAHRRVLEMAKLGAECKVADRILFPKQDSDPRAWAYTFEEPAADWTDPGFVDRAWRRSAGGFGDPSTQARPAEAKVATPWTTKAIWLRRHFDYRSKGTIVNVVFEVHHDEDVTVYLNGRKVFSRAGYNNGYVGMPIPVETFRSAVKEGDNVLAVKVIQTVGSQYFDAGLSVLTAEKRER